MAKQYKIFRMPLKAYNNFIKKQEKMESVVMNMVGRRIPIPLTKVIIAVSESPINLDDDYLIRLAKRKTYHE